MILQCKNTAKYQITCSAEKFGCVCELCVDGVKQRANRVGMHLELQEIDNFQQCSCHVDVGEIYDDE